jgi:hypothetical protein
MKELFILLTLCIPQVSHCAPGLPLKKGTRWVLAQDLTLQKSGLTPEEFVPYVNIWSLKSNSFIKSSSSSTDSCELRTSVSKKTTKQTSLRIKKTSKFSLTNIQESTMSIMIDIVSLDPKKTGVDQIQITCSAYEQGLDDPELKQKFKAGLSTSLARIFTSKSL